MLGTAGLVSGGVGALGGLLQNAANRREASRARAFNAAEAQKNRDFQAEMSNSAYQRATADMRAAGINPMLAYQKGGASTPGGASASGPAARMENISSGAVNSALSARRLKQDIAQSQANIALTSANEQRVQTQTMLDLLRIPEIKARGDAASMLGALFQEAGEGINQLRQLGDSYKKTPWSVPTWAQPTVDQTREYWGRPRAPTKRDADIGIYETMELLRNALEWNWGGQPRELPEPGRR